MSSPANVHARSFVIGKPQWCKIESRPAHARETGQLGCATAKWGNDAALPSATIVLPAGRAVKRAELVKLRAHDAGVCGIPRFERRETWDGRADSLRRDLVYHSVIPVVAGEAAVLRGAIEIAGLVLYQIPGWNSSIGAIRQRAKTVNRYKLPGRSHLPDRTAAVWPIC